MRKQMKFVKYDHVKLLSTKYIVPIVSTSIHVNCFSTRVMHLLHNFSKQNKKLNLK